MRHAYRERPLSTTYRRLPAPPSPARAESRPAGSGAGSRLAGAAPVAVNQASGQCARMRALLMLLAVAALSSCRRSDPAHAPETGVERLEKQYRAWAARQPRPTSQIIDHLEDLLAQEPCVGSMQKWVRFYGYNRLPGNTVSTRIIDFHLDEAGPDAAKSDRHITAPDSWVGIDDRPIRMAFGDYDLKDGRIRLAFCGNNLGSSGSGGIDHMRTYFDELERRRATR